MSKPVLNKRIVSKPGSEKSIIQRIERAFRVASSHGKSGLRLALGDDAALWQPAKGFETVLSCDWFLEGSHFWRDKHPPDAIGWKCLARATSDIAAMGGIPRIFLVSLALPQSHTGKWFEEFLKGLRRASRSLGCELAGGDTTRSEKVLINIMVVGEVKAGSAVLRSGARPGDILYVSGTLGQAEAGLQEIRKRRSLPKPLTPALKKHLYPEPRLELGQWLGKNGLASAMMDISDGLSTDLARLCAASGTGARILAARLPVLRGASPLAAEKLALDGGDDYELLFTVPGKKSKFIPMRFGRLPLTPIGEISDDKKILLLENDGDERPLSSAGWDPFRKKPAR